MGCTTYLHAIFLQGCNLSLIMRRTICSARNEIRFFVMPFKKILKGMPRISLVVCGGRVADFFAHTNIFGSLMSFLCGF